MKLTKMAFGLMALVAVALTTACSEDDDKNFELTGGTLTEQTFYADDLEAPQGIKFTAKQPWTAYVTEGKGTRAGGSEVEWLTLSDYSGEAGDWTLTLTLQENLTGKDRSATITIVCGEDVITITIVQKGTNEDGTSPVVSQDKLLKKATFNWDNDDEASYIELEYDFMNRLTRMAMMDNEDSAVEWINIEYTNANEVAISEDSNRGRGILNDMGYLTKFVMEGEGGYREYEGYEYDAQGHLTKITYDDEYFSSTQTFNYSDDLLTKITYSGNSWYEEYEYPINLTYAKKIPNTMNVDLIWALAMYDLDVYMVMRLAGMLGKRVPYMPEILHYSSGEGMSDEVPFMTPNVTEHRTSYSTHCTQDYANLAYAQNTDGTISKITVTAPMVKIVKEYDAVVSNQLIDSDNPSWGYKYTETNVKTTSTNYEAVTTIDCEYYE